MKRFIVKDSFGYFMRVFSTYFEACNYKWAFGNPNWTIEERG